jgi:hypothetical protein
VSECHTAPAGSSIAIDDGDRNTFRVSTDLNAPAVRTVRTQRRSVRVKPQPFAQMRKIQYRFITDTKTLAYSLR